MVAESPFPKIVMDEFCMDLCVAALFLHSPQGKHLKRSWDVLFIFLRLRFALQLP